MVFLGKTTNGSRAASKKDQSKAKKDTPAIALNPKVITRRQHIKGASRSKEGRVNSMFKMREMKDYRI